MRSHIDSLHGFDVEGGEGGLDVKDLRILAELHKAMREQTLRIGVFVSVTSFAMVAFVAFISSL